MCPQLTYHAFISGTFDDIAQWRSQVLPVLREHKMVAVEMAERNHAAADVKADLDRELHKADFVICIVGDRYGSRIDDKPLMPSWTHYEYETFRRKTLTKDDPLYGQRGMLVLMPKEPSIAKESCSTGAKDAFEKHKVSAEEKDRDKKALEFFKLCILGGARIDPPPKDVIDVDNDYVKIDLDRPSRTQPATFGDRTEFEKRILNFLLSEALVRIGAGERFPSKHAAAAAPPLTVPAALLSRLAPEPRPAALCAVTPRFDAHGLQGGEVAAAIASANPWGDGDRERIVDWSLLTAGQDEEDLLRVLAKQHFGVKADTVEALCAAIADDILEADEPVMLRLTGIPTRGYARPLIEKAWPLLEAAIRNRRKPDSRAGLFLVLSVEAIPEDLARFCQLATAKPEALSKPILITPAALGLAGPASAGAAADPREPIE